jgi:Cys-tRNA(Pro)/Cys-tRNA(Cys) deacylase
MDRIPAIEFLKDTGVEFDIITFPKSTNKGIEAISKALEIDTEKVVKTLIFIGRSGVHYNCLLGGNSRVDYKKLKKITEEKSIRLATPDEILQVTGYQVGAIPPFALKTNLKTLIEISLRSQNILYVGAGKFGVEICLNPEDLRKITKGEFVDISKKNTQ